ncbi:MAG: hypothetical protein EOM52_07995, partial [Clostridia bacterium]|nr:hypothetical protein [Clostridia bacterium]
MLAFSLSVQLICLIILGIFIQKRGLVDNRFDQSLSNFLLDISLPCVIVKSLNVEFSPGELLNCGVLLALALGVFAVSAALGQLFYRFSGKTAAGRILRFGTMFSNFTFVGFPVVETLNGEQGLFYFVVFLVPIRMIYYSSAKPLLAPPGLELEKKTALAHIRSWMTPPVIAVFVGLFLYLTQLPLPSLVTSIVGSVGSVCSPMGMILCGISLGKYEIRSLLKPRNLLLPLVRNLLCPALFFGAMLLLPVDPLIAKVVVIFAALPVASLLAAFTIQYDPAPESCFLSAGGVLLSTLLSAV